MRTQAGSTGTLPINLTGRRWTAPVTLSLAADSLPQAMSIGFALAPNGQPSSSISTGAPAWVYLIANTTAATPAGLYEVTAIAQSGAEQRRLQVLVDIGGELPRTYLPLIVR